MVTLYCWPVMKTFSNCTFVTCWNLSQRWNRIFGPGTVGNLAFSLYEKLQFRCRKTDDVGSSNHVTVHSFILRTAAITNNDIDSADSVISSVLWNARYNFPAFPTGIVTSTTWIFFTPITWPRARRIRHLDDKEPNCTVYNSVAVVRGGGCGPIVSYE